MNSILKVIKLDNLWGHPRLQSKDGTMKWGHDISLKTINVLRILLGWGHDINMKTIKVAQIHKLAEPLT